MPIQKIFWQDPYLTELKAKVTNVQGEKVTLDRTIAFAFSGGQASDRGTIGSFEILEARKEEKEIYYTLPPDYTLKTGDEVEIKIDWQRRYRLMRLHFAAELVLELVYQNFDRPHKFGAHIEEDKARLDFAWKGNISKTFPLLEAKLKELIETDHKITSGFDNEENEKRFWEIEGFAHVPCGGTHLKSTGEIGRVRLKRTNPGKGKERIEIYLVS